MAIFLVIVLLTKVEHQKRNAYTFRQPLMKQSCDILSLSVSHSMVFLVTSRLEAMQSWMPAVVHFQLLDIRLLDRASGQAASPFLCICHCCHGIVEYELQSARCRLVKRVIPLEKA